MSPNEPRYPVQTPAEPEGFRTDIASAQTGGAPVWQPSAIADEPVQSATPAVAPAFPQVPTPPPTPAAPPAGSWTAPPAPATYGTDPNRGWQPPAPPAWQQPYRPWAPPQATPPYMGPQSRAGSGRRLWPLVLAVAMLSASLSAAGTYVVIAVAPQTAAVVTATSQPAAAQQAGVAQSDTIVRVVNLVKSSVVTITSAGVSGSNPYSSGTGVGSGFIVKANGLILTNYHVVDGASSLTVTLSDSRELTATGVSTDPTHDLALVRVSATGLTAVTLGDSSTVQVGQLAIAIGSPLGTFTDSVTQGIVSGLNRTITVGDSTTGVQEDLTGLIQTDAAINPGNSGGPLLDASGNVVGIITASASNAQDMSFAIGINQAKSMISSAH